MKRTSFVFPCPITCRRLYDLPLHWLFQTEEVCHHQSGRILRASWGLFCVAMFAAYAALLASTATAPLEYPKLSSLEDLLAHPELKIGISPSSSSFITRMKKAKPGTTHGRLWQVMSRQNRSDLGTFSSDKGHHIRNVAKGKYAFIGNVPRELLHTFVDDLGDVRFVTLSRLRLKTAIPQDALYKRSMEGALRSAYEMGVIRALLQKWFPPAASPLRSRADDKTEVDFSRLDFLIYVSTIGVGLAVLSVAVERFIHWRRCLQR